MSCDYPCSICDPDEWEEESKPPPYDFDAVYERAESALERSFDKDASVLWWVPMEGWPEDVTIGEERDIEDVTGMYGSRPMTMLMGQRFYMKRERGWGSGVDSFYIISYMTKVLDWEKGISYISAVQSRTPPPWGWWMPTLAP